MGPVEFVETGIFTKRIVEMLSDHEYGALQAFLIKRPEGGALILGGRGLRKLRWSLGGKGKRGGVRIIYYLYLGERRIYPCLEFIFPERRQGLPQFQLR